MELQIGNLPSAQKITEESYTMSWEGGAGARAEGALHEVLNYATPKNETTRHSLLHTSPYSAPKSC